MANVVQICNFALGRVGISAAIESLGDDSEEAAACNRFYEIHRDKVLQAYNWPFARKRSVLSTLAQTRSGWTYVYALPADCIQPRGLYPEQRAPTVDQRIPFTVELADDGASQVLITDLEDAELLYTARVSTPLVFSPEFVSALAWSLASDLALSLKKDNSSSLNAAQRFNMEIGQAWASALRGEQPDVPPDSEFISVRS